MLVQSLVAAAAEMYMHYRTYCT